MLRVIPFEPADYVALFPQVYAWNGHAPDAQTIARQYVTGGPAWSGWDGEMLLGSAGVLIPWPGFGTAWAVLSDAGRQRPIQVHRAVLREFRSIIQAHRLQRVEATILADQPIQRRWVESMGFERALTMPAWGPRGETAHRYVLYPVLTRVEHGVLIQSYQGRDFVKVEGRVVPAIAGGYGAEVGTVVAIAGMAATVAAAGVSAYAASEAGAAQERASKFNAKLAANQAEQAKMAARVAEEQDREEKRRLLARQRAFVGGTGVTSEGSPLAVMLDSVEQAELNAQRIRAGGVSQAGAIAGGIPLIAFQGRQAARAGTISAGTSLLGGIASAASAYARSVGTQPINTP